MLTTRWDGPATRLGLRDEWDRLLSGFAGTPWPMGLASGLDVRSGAFPALVVSERGSDFVVEAELPGMKLDDIELLVMGDELTIKGERKEPSLAGAREHRRERAFGTFYRAIRLPVEVEADAVKASLENGVLTVTLPKAKAALPRKIEVKAASR